MPGYQPITLTANRRRLPASQNNWARFCHHCYDDWTAGRERCTHTLPGTLLPHIADRAQFVARAEGEVNVLPASCNTGDAAAAASPLRSTPSVHYDCSPGWEESAIICAEDVEITGECCTGNI